MSKCEDEKVRVGRDENLEDAVLSGVSGGAEAVLPGEDKGDGFVDELCNKAEGSADPLTFPVLPPIK